MERTVTENLVCGTCGVDVRPNSMFCYNCGGDVSTAAPAENEKQSSIKPIIAAETSKLVMPTAKEESAEIEETRAEIKTAVNNDISKKAENAAEKEPKLKSAASMRRESKTFQRKNVEVVWEEPESSSLLRLFLVTLFLLIFAAVTVYLAVYNK